MLSPVQHLGEYIREQRTAAQISLRSLAARAGVSNPYLSQVERGLRKPSAGVLAQIAQGLQISTESLLIKAGILSAADAGAVVDAIRADPQLTDHHKSVLIEIYSAFRQESAEGQDGTDGPATSTAR
jgi:transcriptional regulator with XRE-family HTH domain